MPVTAVETNLDDLMFVITTELDISAERAWELWSDPGQLERWWGPPTYPATVTEHNLVPGGRVAYCMTGPTGDEHPGWWSVTEVVAPRTLVFSDGFADESGLPNHDLPVIVSRVDIVDRPGGVTMTVSSDFPTREAMEQILAMGMVEGMTQAMGQIDGVLD